GAVGDELSGVLVHAPMVDGEAERGTGPSGRQRPGGRFGGDGAGDGDRNGGHRWLLCCMAAHVRGGRVGLQSAPRPVLVSRYEKCPVEGGAPSTGHSRPSRTGCALKSQPSSS